MGQGDVAHVGAARVPFLSTSSSCTRSSTRAASAAAADGRQHIWCAKKRDVFGALCLYLKTDSYGEYIFDREWARTYQQYGALYYPGLVAAVPFTPATGSKLLLRPDVDVTTRARVTKALLEAARTWEESTASSSHALFLPKHELERVHEERLHSETLAPVSLAQPGLRDVFGLSGGASGGSGGVRSARTTPARGGGAEISHLTGDALLPEHATLMHSFYPATLDGAGRSLSQQGILRRGLQNHVKDRSRQSSPATEPEAPWQARSTSSNSSLFGRYWGAAHQVQPALRTVLLPGYRVRDRARLPTPGGGRPGRASWHAASSPLSHLQRL